MRLFVEYIPSGTGLAGTSNGRVLHQLDCLIVFFFSSLCQFELSVMKGVLCNWQIAGKSARWGGRGKSGSWSLKISKAPPILLSVKPSVSPSPFSSPSAVFLSFGEKFDSGLLWQIKRDRYSMIQYSMSWKDLNAGKAGCCTTPTISLSNPGDASEVSRTISGSRLQAADWAATRLSHSCSTHPHLFPCLPAPPLMPVCRICR